MTEKADEKRTPADQYRSLLLQLPDVYAANIVMDGEDSVRELHVVAGLSRNPKQISRDVQSALLATFGLRVDHHVISIAQLAANPFEGQESPQYITASSRIQCIEVTTSVEEKHYHVNVRLRHGEQDFSGEAVCRNTSSQCTRATVQATLDAVHHFLGVEDLFNVLATQTSTIGSTAVAMTLLEYSFAKENRLLIGAVQQKDDVAVSFVKSALDAMNRSLSIVVGCKIK